MSATYEQILDGLHARFATVTGIKRLLKYEPTSIQAFPTLYSLLDRVEYSDSGQVEGDRYFILHRLVFRWVDNEQAELELMPFVTTVPASVRADRQLGGTLNKGVAKITTMQATFVTIGGTLYRCLDFTSNTLSK